MVWSSSQAVRTTKARAGSRTRETTRKNMECIYLYLQGVGLPWTQLMEVGVPSLPTRRKELPSKAMNPMVLSPKFSVTSPRYLGESTMRKSWA